MADQFKDRVGVRVELVLDPMRNGAPKKDLLQELKDALYQLELRVEVTDDEEAYLIYVASVEEIEPPHPRDFKQ